MSAFQVFRVIVMFSLVRIAIREPSGWWLVLMVGIPLYFFKPNKKA